MLARRIAFYDLGDRFSTLGDHHLLTAFHQLDQLAQLRFRFGQRRRVHGNLTTIWLVMRS
jgi:hypothetical protein